MSKDALPRARHLASRLREVRRRAGIGISTLARGTDCSTSQWRAYLNGTAIPPRRVIEEAARVAELSGVDTMRLLALWELAMHEDSLADADTVATTELPAALTDMTLVVPRRRRWRLIGGALLGAIALAVAGVVMWPKAPARTPSAPLSSATTQNDYSCHYTTRDGLRYAGHSDTTTQVVIRNAIGPDVIEVQCLLIAHQFDPGSVDGIFGEHTEKAVRRFQRSAGDEHPDGKVDPQTWALLRK